MNYTAVQEKIAEIFMECQVRSFPIDCFDILSSYGYRVYSYQELDERNHEVYEMCRTYSEEAFHEKSGKIVAYNELRPIGRIRFSLMHELGHILLRHPTGADCYEKEANYFASHILAPRIAIHYAGCRNSPETARCFNMTLEAAGYAFQDYRRWRRAAVYQMSMVDQRLYQHFYDRKAGCFVYHRSHCAYCSKEILNSTASVCHHCDTTMFRSRSAAATAAARVSACQISDSRLYDYLETGR